MAWTKKKTILDRISEFKTGEFVPPQSSSMEPIPKRKIAVLAHGIFSSADRTSLKKMEAQLIADGYDVYYVEGSPATQKAQMRAIERDNQDANMVFVGHSLGGLPVNQMSNDFKGRSDRKFVTINSPFSSANDNATDVKDWEWSTILDIGNWIEAFDGNKHFEETGKKGHDAKPEHFKWIDFW